jgi:transposase-like protein
MTEYHKRTPEFIDMAVTMATSGTPDAPTMRAVARQLGIAHTTLRNWIHRAASDATTANSGPRSEHLGHADDDDRHPYPDAARPVASRDGRRRGPALAKLVHDYERLVRENEALKAALVLLARDLDTRT